MGLRVEVGGVHASTVGCDNVKPHKLKLTLNCQIHLSNAVELILIIYCISHDSYMCMDTPLWYYYYLCLIL